MQQDTLRDFLKFFRFHLPWFVLSAGFFAVILLTGLYVSSRISKLNQLTEQTAQEQLLELSPEEINNDSIVLEQPLTPSPIIPAMPSPAVMPTPLVTPQPITTPTAPVEKKQALPSTYIVQSGDTLWDISVRTYGTGSDYSWISRANQLTDPNQITIGQKLELPEKSGKIASGVSIDYGDSLDNQNLSSYQIIKGDSLWKIAEQRLGDPYRWVEIYQLNKPMIGSNPDLIYPHVLLQMPEKVNTFSFSSQTQSSNWTSTLLQ